MNFTNPKHYTEPKASIQLIKRAEWDAEMQDGDIPPLQLPATNVFFTYTGTSQCSYNSNTLPSCHNVVKNIQQEAIFEHGLPDIPYNFLLGGDGCVYEGRGWRLKPEPIPDEPELNERNTLVVAYIGKKEEEIPKYRKKTLDKLEKGFMQYCISSGNIDYNADVYYAPATPKSWSANMKGERNADNELVEEEEDDDDGGDLEDDPDFVPADGENMFEEDPDFVPAD
ncbi:peptidoglycan-recognition protein LF-like isoform X1 [Macrosteles quadrilineatus]|uniref:peptidoglycan-recognition protein LF-like isoform X1 n=1 Tax=Macrosteles quadrilineatus TaxID=74068 RepID=UPI0023E16256|nr:peptidoglycan-recognition protein LF-like isoform X1 [Macrosteles quadrilineatus]